MKTVIKPSSPPHPAEVNEHLGLAYQLCNKLIEAAELRGDQTGADAWLVARNAIEAAEKAMREAREKQTWRTVQGERVDRPWLNAPCPACGAAIGTECKPPFDHPLRGPGQSIHRARANLLGMDFKPIACSQGTLGCRGRGEMHACVSE